MLRPLIVWITTNWKTLKEMGIPPDLPSEKSVCRSRSKLELDMDNRMVPNREQSTSRLYTVTVLI